MRLAGETVAHLPFSRSAGGMIWMEMVARGSLRKRRGGYRRIGTHGGRRDAAGEYPEDEEQERR